MLVWGHFRAFWPDFSERRWLVEERRIVTVLFCDVTGSTALASQIDAEDWAEIISGVFPLLIEPVKRYDGTVARLMGDAILAFFGAPSSHEDDPQRAILAALSIQTGITAYREQVRKDYGLDINVRVGINTGIVVTGEFGAAGASEYTAMGDAVNVAARMEQTASPGTIQITADTHALVYPYFLFEPLGPIDIKGKPEPVDAFRVTGVSPSVAHHRDISVPLIGRERELAALTDRIAGLQAGQGGVLALIGDAGLGKSRVLQEARQAVTPAGPAWIEDRLVSYEVAAPYALIRRRICDGLSLPVMPSEEQVRTQVRAVLPELSSTDHERAIRTVRVLLGSPPDQARDAGAGAPTEGDDFRHNLAEIVMSLWECWIGESGSGVYVVDDFQHADVASLDVLGLLLSMAGSLPLLVILALRPEQHTAAWAFHKRLGDRRSNGYVRIMLRSLAETDAGKLVDSLLSGMTPPDDFRERLIDRVGGNPLFAEEIVRSLIGRRMVVEHQEDSQAALRLAPNVDLAEVTIPTTLRSLMQERMDRLSPDARRTLQIAAVIGRTFRHAEIEAVLEAPDSINAHLMELQQAMLIQRADGFQAREYNFNHALTWEAAYRIILNRHRRRLHRQVGEALEQLYADQMAEQGGAFGYAAVIADHFARGGDPARAAHWYRRAGSQAAVQFAHAEALRSLTLALELTPEEDAAAQAAIILDRERIHHLLGQREEQERDLAGLGSLAEALDDDRLRREMLLRRAKYADATGDFQAAIRAAREAIALAEVAGDASAAAEGHVIWGAVLWHQGEYGAARTPLNQALALARDSSLPALEADALRHLGIVADAEGNLAGARDAFEKALQMMREVGDRRGEGSALNSLGIVAYNQRAYSDACAFYVQSLTVKQEIGDRNGQGKSLHNLGIAAHAQGDLADARSWFEQALAVTEEIADREGQGAALEGLGAVALFTGDFVTAARYLNDALRISVDIGDQLGECETRANLGLLDHYLGDDAAALTQALEAVRIAREVGEWQSLVRALICLGHSHLALDNLECAEVAFREAAELSGAQPSHSLTMESLAGLARVRLERGARDEALAHVEVIMTFLENDTLDGAEDPVLVHLICYEVLNDRDPQRAQSVLQAGWTALQSRADRAGSEAHRRSLLERIPSHRALLNAWECSAET